MKTLLLAFSVFFKILMGAELPVARLRAAGLLPAAPLPILGRSSAAATAPTDSSPAPTTPAPVAATPAPVMTPAAAPEPSPQQHHQGGKHGKKGKKGPSERLRGSERLAVATPAPAPAPAAVAPAPVAAPALVATPAPVAPPPAPLVVRDAAAEQVARDEGALLFLAALQREGRLLDFLMEKIDGYSDDQVGAAVRGIHSGCSKAIGATLVVEPVLPGAEDSPVTLPSGYDAQAIHLTGNVRGQPPFKGTLKHHGWKARPQKPLQAAHGANPAVVMPAEVEL